MTGEGVWIVACETSGKNSVFRFKFKIGQVNCFAKKEREKKNRRERWEGKGGRE